MPALPRPRRCPLLPGLATGLLLAAATSRAASPVGASAGQGSALVPHQVLPVLLVPLALSVGVDDASAPARTTNHVREVAPWTLRPRLAVSIGVALAVQALLIAGLLIERVRRRRAELASRQNMAKLAHLDRVSALGGLVGTLAHEVNTPLAAVMNDARAARRFLDADPQQLDDVRDSVNAIETHARRALEVIQRIRSSLRTEPGDPVMLDLNDAAREAGRLVSGWAADRAVQLEVQTARRPLGIKGDPVQIQQVILNLLLNAVDASAGQPPERRRVSLRTEAGTASAMVTVRDWGDGIADGSRLFEPFYTTKTGGLGLGLSISQTIVGVHGGAISGGPGDGPGALFRVELPLVAERAKAQEATS